MSHKNNESIWVKESKNIFNFVFLLICISLIIEIYVEYIETGLSINCFHDIYNLTVVSISFILFRCKLIKASVSYSIIHYTVITSIMTSVYYKVNLPDFNFETFFLKSQILIMSLTIAIAFLIKPTHIWYSNILNFIFILCNYIFLGELYTLSKFIFYFVIVLGTGIGCYLIQSNFYKLRKQVRNTNKKLTEQNKELNKSNIAKDQMFKIIGHDLRTPFGQMSELLRMYENSEEQIPKPELIKMMREATNNGNELLVGLMNWVKSENYEIKITEKVQSLNSIINNVITFFTSTSLQKKVSLINTSQNDIEINYDVLFLETVLRNLVSNAIKYSHKNSAVFIKSEIVNNELNISIIDKGIGMSNELLNSLFETNLNSTSRGTNEEEGTGFGLTICRQLIKKHDGFLIITSEKDRGTTMTINLPYKKRAE